MHVPIACCDIRAAQLWCFAEGSKGGMGTGILVGAHGQRQALGAGAGGHGGTLLGAAQQGGALDEMLEQLCKMLEQAHSHMKGGSVLVPMPSFPPLP